MHPDCHSDFVLNLHEFIVTIFVPRNVMGKCNVSKYG